MGGARSPPFFYVSLLSFSMRLKYLLGHVGSGNGGGSGGGGGSATAAAAAAAAAGKKKSGGGSKATSKSKKNSKSSSSARSSRATALPNRMPGVTNLRVLTLVLTKNFLLPMRFKNCKPHSPQSRNLRPRLA